MRSCYRFDECDANLCPKDRDPGIEVRTWYPDEDVCPLRVGVPRWVKVQRRIKARCRLGAEAGYFTILDLVKIQKVGPGIRGRTSEKDHPRRNEADRLKIIALSGPGGSEPAGGRVVVPREKGKLTPGLSAYMARLKAQGARGGK